MTSNCIEWHKNRLARLEDFFQSTRQASLSQILFYLITFFISISLNSEFTHANQGLV